jgi:6-pyruvoyltetrahydropterin/6-carboxytetrahydropterin synthase
MNITATKRFTFEAAHYLEGYDGKCGHVHGHSYVVEVTVGSTKLIDSGAEKGMVMDLVRVKEVVNPIIDHFDHALLVERETWVMREPNEGEPESCQQCVSPYDQEPRIAVLGYRPTTENIAIDLFKQIDDQIREVTDHAYLRKLRIRETETSWIEVDAD